MDGGATEDAGAGSFAILGGLAGWWAYRNVALSCLAFFLSVLLNATLLVAFIRRPGLRTISNRFVMNLIGSNLLAIVVLSALLIMDSSGPASLGLSEETAASFCAIAEGGTAFVTTSSILSVLLIGLDQYFAVVDPLRYRTRIDKLKCGLLILAVWLLALVFGLLAALNPEPRSFWYLCSGGGGGSSSASDDRLLEQTETLRVRASIVLSGNATESANLEIDGEIRFAEPRNLSAERSLFTDESDESEDSLISSPATYGRIYALVYALFGYLVPFLAICWIYASIYRAARNNSERTRRTGSRPVLSSGSFSEEGAPGGYRADCSVEDFRRIPKISSLSSIDENSEATPSQLGCANNGPLSCSNEHVHYEDEEDEEERDDKAPPANHSSVVFTMGSSKVEGSSRLDNAKDNNSTKSKVPISELRAKFLSESRRGSKGGEEEQEKEVVPEEVLRSKFPEVAEQRRKSSHDLMYEEMMLGCGKHPYEYDEHYDDDDDDEDDNSSDEEEEEDEERRRDYEEALPLSAACAPESGAAQANGRSNSVNFDLGEAQQQQTQQSSSNNPGSPSQPLPIVTITPPGQKTVVATPPAATPIHRVPSVKSTHGYINNLKYKISNGSLFKYREETRAARVSALVVVMGFICWTPYVYLLLARNLPVQAQLDDSSSSAGLEIAALGFLVLATFVTPLLFGYRSRRVKRELKRFFCFKRELSYKNNRSLMAKKVLRRRHSGATILSQIVGESDSNHTRYSIFNCMYGRTRWPKDKVQFVQVPDTALAVETCRSSFSSGASTQISSTSTDEC